MNRNKQALSTKEAVQNIIRYSQKNSNLLQKYNSNFFIHYFDKCTIQQLGERFKPNERLSKERFVKELTCFILHRSDQTLYLVISLINIFNRIINEIKSNKDISFKDFTYYICKSIINQNQIITICNKQICIDKINPNAKVIRSIDINPAVIILDPSQQAPKISKDIKKIQRKVHDFKPNHHFYYCQERKQIITLARLASQIKIYNLNLKEVTTIHPTCFKIYDRNMVILSMSFSEKYQRIGCIIANLGIVFWDYGDDFQTQKLIKSGIGDKIYYLSLLDEWITIQNNKVYFWDLKYQRIKDSFEQIKAKNINDIKEITHLRCFIVSYTFHDDSKWLYVYMNDNNKLVSKLKLKNVGAQKIHYNRVTQTIMLIGLNQLPIYQIDHYSFEINLITYLYGHKSIITAISDIGEGLIMTGDDRGILRIWDLKILRCQQVLKVAKTITNIQCVGNYVLFSDTRINIMKIQETNHRIPLNEHYGIKKFYRLSNNIYELFIFTLINCRIYDLKNGKTKKVVQICIQDDQILYVQQVNQDFIIATTKCFLCCYSEDMNRKWKMSMTKYHQDDIIYIKADKKNNLFTTISKGGHINVWNIKTMLQEGPRKSIINRQDKQFKIDYFDLSQKYSIIITCCQQSNQIIIWDYQFCKLCHVIEAQSQICSLKVSDSFPLLTVGCQNEKIYLYKIERNQNIFKVQLLNITNLRYPQNNLNSLLSLRSFVDLRQLEKKDKEDLFKKLQCNHILFFHQRGTNMLVLSYGRGNIIVLNLNRIIQQFKDIQFHKTTSNIQRPVKQIIDKPMKFGHYRITRFQDINNSDFLPVVWNKKVHKDTITDIDNFQNNYISTLGIDGYLKIICVEKYQIIAKLSIRYPLPSVWNYKPFQFQEFGKKIYEAISLLFDIIDDKQMSISKAQLDILSINQFLRTICNRKLTPANKKHRTIHLLKDELSPEDLLKIRVIEQEKTLKYLQAFKRVNLMKQIKQERYSFNQNSNKRYTILKQQKQYFKQLLSPDYLPNLYGRPNDQTIDKEFNQIIKSSLKHSLVNSKQKDCNSSTLLNTNKQKSMVYLYDKLNISKIGSNLSLYENSKINEEDKKTQNPHKKIDIEQIRKKLQIYNGRNKMPSSNLPSFRGNHRYHRSSHNLNLDKDDTRFNKRLSVLQQYPDKQLTAVNMKNKEIKSSSRMLKMKQNNQTLLKKIHKQVKNKFFFQNN